MPANTKVSIEPVIATPSTPIPAKKVIVKKIIKKVPASMAPAAQIPVTQAVNDTQKKRYADASSGVPLEIRNQQLLFAGIILGVIAILTTIGLFIYRTKIVIENIEDIEIAELVEEEPVSDQLSEPVATPLAEVEEVTALTRKEITIEILNGSSVAGLAGDTALEFQELGYELPEAGNSDVIEVSELYVSDKVTEEELATFMKDVERRLGITEITDFIKLDTTVRIVLGSDQS